MLVQYEQPNQHVALIRLNRPEKMNAFSTGLERDLLTALQRACGDEEVRVVVFAGGGKAFSGGWDLAESDLTDPEHHPLSGRAGRHTWLEVMRTLRHPMNGLASRCVARNGTCLSPPTSSTRTVTRWFGEDSITN